MNIMKWIHVILIRIGRIMINLIYILLRGVCGSDNSITFLSRQTNSLGIDYKLIIDQLNSKYPGCKIRTLSCRYRGKQDNIIKFAFVSLKSLYYIAKSDVCVLDSYWPMISLLDVKNRPAVIQIWHSLCKIKKSGYQTMGKPGGRSEILAKELKMHRNYDYVITPSEFWNPFYMEAFDIAESNINVIGLPRVDYIKYHTLSHEDKAAIIKDINPENKLLLLYLPTYRNYSIDSCFGVVEKFAAEKGAKLLCHMHPNQCVRDNKIIAPYKSCEKYNIKSLIEVCDFVITDYSSLVAEAILLEKYVLFNVSDVNRYKDNYGLNFNPLDIFPSLCFRNTDELNEIVAEYDTEAYNNLKQIFSVKEENCSETIADLVCELCNESDTRAFVKGY